MKNLIVKNYPFLLPFLIFILFGAFVNFYYTQKTLFFFFNGSHFPMEDELMRYYTNVGDGIFTIAIILILAFFISLRKGIITLAAFLLTGLTVQILKRYIFIQHKRPWSLYTGNENLHIVAGYHPYSNNSFPSGHSATAFSIFFLLAVFSRRKGLGLIYFILAMLVAYSRIYLSQHFFIDTYFGALIGVVLSILSYTFLNKETGLLKSTHYDKGLFFRNSYLS